MNSLPTDEFVRELTDYQSRLFGYILSLVPDRECAGDVMQNTNVVLWKKSHEFRAGTSFSAWAFSIARLEVLAYLRKRSRDRHVFDVELVEHLADRAEFHANSLSDVGQFLDECVELRTAEEKAMLQERYEGNLPVTEMAARRGCDPNVVSKVLFRIRRKLYECVGRKMEAAS